MVDCNKCLNCDDRYCLRHYYIFKANPSYCMWFVEREVIMNKEDCIYLLNNRDYERTEQAILSSEWVRLFERRRHSMSSYQLMINIINMDYVNEEQLIGKHFNNAVISQNVYDRIYDYGFGCSIVGALSCVDRERIRIING